MDTEKKIKQSVNLLKSAFSQHNYTLAFSGGKDSVVCDYLCREAGFQVPKVYNSTTIDPPGTISFCEKKGCKIVRPQYTYLQLIERNGMPTMFRRFCCRFLKEAYISDFLITGVRASESVRRKKRYCSFESVFHYSKSISTQMLHPLAFYNDNDIAYIINTRHLECHPLYYDNEGIFHIERRLGCIGCPLKGDRGRADYLAHPKLLVQVAKRLIRFHIRMGKTSNDAYLNMMHHLFYSNHGYNKFLQATEGLFPIDPKEALERYFNIELP